MSHSPSHITKSEEQTLAYEVKLKKVLLERKGVDPLTYNSKRQEYYTSIDESLAKSTSLPFPTTVNIELINKCNYKCEMCFTVNHEGPSKILSFESFKKIVDECYNKNLLTLFIANGSEPLIFPDFKKYLTYACDKIPDIGVFTNGVKLDKHMADFLLASGVTRLNISLDAATPETYTLIRGGNLESVESNINYLLHHRDSEYGPLVRVSFCVQDRNRHEIDAFRKKWEPLVDSVEFQSLHMFDNLPHYEVGDDLFSGQHSSSTAGFCYSPFSYLAVWSDGTVSPCCTFHGQKLSLGNINSPSASLSAMWTGERMSNLRQQFRVQKLNPVCEDCLSCTIHSF